jgi:glycosyltransferase involved in cell wall biosynthesis
MLDKPMILYITYDGLLEPLGESQVLAYMEKLAHEWPVHIVSFEKTKDRRDKARMETMVARLSASGISWTPLTYHKSPSIPATAYDIAQGASIAFWLTLRRKAAIVHVRSYVAGLIALPANRFTGTKLLFDMRGFWADERVDGGLWPNGGRLYRLAKKLERLLLESADHIVTLTQVSVPELRRNPCLKRGITSLSVIPTCADLSRFRPQVTRNQEQFTLGYVGSVGTWYFLDEILTFYLTLLDGRPEARLLFVNRNEHALIRESLARRGISSERFEIVSAEHKDVPRQIARMRAGVAIYKPSYSRIACAPTKLAEYLGCGVPCVGNVGVGDMEEILEGKRVGVALRDFSQADHKNAVDRLLALCDEPELRSRCIATAHELFSLEAGVDAYHQIYLELCGIAVPTQNGRGLGTTKSR